MTTIGMMRTITLAAAAALALAATGCGNGLGGNFGTQGVTPVATPLHVTGNVRGGQQPVSGAVIQLWAVGINGIGSASTPLIAQTITTNANGNFDITGDWDCTSNEGVYGYNPLLYLTATGGNPGLGAGVNNTAIAAMSALGLCNNFTPTTYVSVNEQTTVAAVYALAPFMLDYAHIGGSGEDALENPFALAAMLVSPNTGHLPGPTLPANVTFSLPLVRTLADMIAPCINSDGTGCSPLFTATTINGVVPTEAIGAMLVIAKHPGGNYSQLYNNIPGNAPYQTALPHAPKDWTVALNITGGGLAAPVGIAIDQNGYAWVANAGGNSLTEMDGQGNLLTGSTGYVDPNILGAQGIAIDQSGRPWLANTLMNTVLVFPTMNGQISGSSSVFSGGGIAGPIGIAIARQYPYDVWVANFAGASVTEMDEFGRFVGSSPLTAGGTLQQPIGLAIDANGNVWVTDNGAGVVAEFDPNQNLLSGAGFTDTGILAPIGIAIDVQGNAWVTESGTNAVGAIGAGGIPAVPSPLQGGGLNAPSAVAIDGAGVVWVTNPQAGGSITQISGGVVVSPAAGFGTLNQPEGIAIDDYGGVWTTNAGDNSVTLFVGLATPVLTPIVSSNVGP